MDHECLPNVCHGCGQPGFKNPPGCQACGYGSKTVYAKTLPLPAQRNAEERGQMIERLVRYAIRTGDIEGAVYALTTLTVKEGSSVAMDILGDPFES